MSKLATWIVLFACSLIFVIGGSALIFIGALLAQINLAISAATVISGAGVAFCGFLAMRKMEEYA